MDGWKERGVCRGEPAGRPEKKSVEEGTETLAAEVETV